MRVNNKLKLLYCSAPKTGSLSMNQYLCKFGFKKLGRLHQTEIPIGYEDYFKFMLVRNPYERLVSWWWWWMKMGHDSRTVEMKIGYKDSKFSTFLEWMVAYKDKSPYVIESQQYQSQWNFGQHFNCDIYVDFHSMPESLLIIPGIEKCYEWKNAKMHKHKGTRKPWQEYYTKRNEELAYEHSKEDFKYLGFKRLVV